MILEDGRAAASCNKFDFCMTGFFDGDRLFTAVEIATAHVRDAGCGHLRPILHHSVGILLPMLLDRRSGPAIGVPFPQHRVNGTAQHLGVALLQGFLRVRFGLFRIVGDIVPLVLQLLDRLLQLGNGSADVRQLDDVGLRLLTQLTQLGQIIGDFLIFSQIVGKIRDNSARKRDIPSFQRNTGALGIGLENRKQRVRGQSRGLINFGVDNFRRCCHVSLLRVPPYSQGVLERSKSVCCRAKNRRISRYFESLRSQVGRGLLCSRMR